MNRNDVFIASEEDIRFIKKHFDKNNELSDEQHFPPINVPYVYKRMDACGLSVNLLAEYIGLSDTLVHVMLNLEIFPESKIDTLASYLLIRKGDLIL